MLPRQGFLDLSLSVVPMVEQCALTDLNSLFQSQVSVWMDTCFDVGGWHFTLLLAGLLRIILTTSCTAVQKPARLPHFASAFQRQSPSCFLSDLFQGRDSISADILLL